MHRLYDRLLALDSLLVRHGFPPLSDFWRETFRAFLCDRLSWRQLVARVGRQGGKSTSTCRLAVVVALYGDFTITPGTVGTVVLVSQNRDQSAERLRTIARILTILGVKHAKKKDVIELADRPIQFHVYSATIAGVSGMSCIFACCDELSKWRDLDSGTNPAGEVLASLRPAMVTHASALMVLISSPLSTNDAHHEAFDRGTDDFQLCVQAPTWIANPSVTEERTHQLEPDPRVWAREYAAIPQSAALAAFDPEAVERAFRHGTHPDLTPARRILVIDPSSGRKDAFTWAIVGWDVQAPPKSDADLARIYGHAIERPAAQNRPKIPSVLRVDVIDGVEGSFWDTTDADRIVDRFAALAKAHGANTVASDQREELMLRSAVQRRGLRFHPITWSNTSKVPAVESIRRWLANDQLALPAHEKLRRELHAFEERVTASGAFTFGARGSGHDDYVSLLVTAAMADAAGLLASSPHRRAPVRGNAMTPILPW